ncbi:ammonium transporter [Janthinobacterium sp. PC23-8]|uniref:ammonium transporter n=1 Tax=Janthinobacterium sp. PC23-8 TaxID=2012679 RepID=UPI000B979FA3|nr:ammonium transporter [Janthinobacterium sp. PC23-8]OYO32103.1 ammonia channel protein [Janthinobacterium sp. PC23-8]
MHKNITKLLAGVACLFAFGVSAPSFADAPAKTEPAATTAAVATPEVAPLAVPAAAPAATTAAAPAPAAAPAAAPVPNKGDTGFMMICALLVILMTIPGLALFYGGLVRSKNMLSILMQVFVVFALVIVLWCVYGYSLAFTEGNAFFGTFARSFLNGIWDPATGTFAVAATFTKGVVIPEFVFVAFQGTFAAITCALIIGAFAERAKFSAVLAFVVLWFTFAYIPAAHMVWFWTGPDLITNATTAATEAAKAGWIWQKGALDFAGGTVVHINAAVAGLVGAIMIGKRVGYGRESMAPHSLTMTMIGASLLWVGWFGFNAGSSMEAGDLAALAFVNTLLATAAATLSWVFGEWITKGKPSMLGGASGAVAGLVAITPAAGYVGPMGGLVIGLLAGVICLWGVTGLKRLIGADDSLDVFGVHGVGGILGAILTGVFAAPQLGGQGIFDYVTNKMSADPYSIGHQVWVQTQAVGTTIIWSALVSVIAYKLVDIVIGLRVPEEEEREGLDISSHGEQAYHG